MGSYVVLARKWRPARFSDIVGQDSIVQTLMNAIRQDRVHQAYLFTGSRGIGKTSIARIFSKVLRCPNTQEENEVLSSCDECSNCKEIAQSKSVDVIEIDGASNNGVDAVREIRENVKYLPSSGEKKIYIIDEVHMLTTAAFNALLKTLEEPPAHVIFVFATTEPHKIPATILSRCQRFDLKRVTSAQIQNRMSQIAKEEGLEIETGALPLIAKAAQGSMRDGLSLLDQVIAYSGHEKITLQSTRESIGLIPHERISTIVRGVFQRNVAPVLEALNQIHESGHDFRVLTQTLIEHLHACILAKVEGTSSLGFSEEEWKEIQDLSKLRSLEEMQLIFQVLHHGTDWVARSPQPKLVLDVLLIKCAKAEILTPANTLSQTDVKKNSSAPAQSLATPPKQPQAPASVTKAPRATHTPPPTWEGFIDHVRNSRPLLASILEHGHGEVGDDLQILFKKEDRYKLEQVQVGVYKSQLTQLSESFFGRAIPLSFGTLEESGTQAKAPEESVAARRERERNEREQRLLTEAKEHPIIREAQALFGGELGPIQLRQKSPQVKGTPNAAG